MRIALLGSAKSIHTSRWANGLSARGHDVHLITQHEVEHELASSVTLHVLGVRSSVGYFCNAFELRDILKKIRPEILNAHYASGYGTLARLSGFKPLLLSVWGSDVYDFPMKSPLHRWLIRRNLESATAIASISYCMKRQTRRIYNHPEVFITPFGIDETQFAPSHLPQKESRTITIGTVKTLAPKYGIDTLIRAFAYISAKHPETRLEIVGTGSQEAELRNLAKHLGVLEKTDFKGYVSHEAVPEVLRRFDIYAALSRYDSESFGVAILEASSCAIPVVVSDADGPKEVTLDGQTGFVVPKEDHEAAGRAISRLIEDTNLRESLGAFGRKHVLANYTWSKALDAMEDSLTKAACYSIGENNSDAINQCINKRHQAQSKT